MRLILTSFLLLLLNACSSVESSGEATTAIKVNVKYEDHSLALPSDWIGGTAENPRYYTAKGEEIITPLYGVDVAPVTKRSVDGNRVIYPHSGYQVTGDLKINHYLQLIKKVSNIDFKRRSYKAPEIVADSNFLEKGALVYDETGKLLVEYEYKLLDWHVKE